MCYYLSNRIGEIEYKFKSFKNGLKNMDRCYIIK